MQQYFIQQAITPVEEVHFEESQIHHLCKVMRFQSGQLVYVVDSLRHKYVVELQVEKTIVVGRVVEEVKQVSEFPFDVVIAQGLIKGDRFDFFLQKCSELGATSIIPLQTNRVVVKVHEEKSEKKIARWQKIAIEASEQSRRTQYPLIQQPMTLKELVKIDADIKIVAYEESLSEVAVLKKTCKAVKQNQKLLFVAGCEGGFDEKEIDYLTEHGFLRCSLGPRILRAESAAMYFLSALSYEVELREDEEIK